VHLRPLSGKGTGEGGEGAPSVDGEGAPLMLAPTERWGGEGEGGGGGGEASVGGGEPTTTAAARRQKKRIDAAEQEKLVRAINKSIEGLVAERATSVPAMRELLRQRILFGANWRDRSAEIERLDGDELARLEAFAGVLNHKLIRHAGAASGLAHRLDDLLLTAGEHESERAEAHYLQRASLIASGSAPSTMLDWAKTRAGELKQSELRIVRPHTALPSLATRPEFQPPSERAAQQKAPAHRAAVRLR
jgi:hypothetical protein